MATLEDLMQQLESLASDDKATSKQSSISTKKAELAKEKIVSNGLETPSKLDLGQDSCHKGKAVMADRVNKEPRPWSSTEKKAEHTAKRYRKTIIVIICEDCYLLHYSQCRVDNSVAYKLDYKYPTQECSTARTLEDKASSQKLYRTKTEW